jgi:transposase-like protein
MPAPKDPEFRRRAVELVRLREKPIAQIARDLGIAESGLRRWMAQADIDEGQKEGLTSHDRAERVQLRRENRVQAMEIEILKRASAYFARENVVPIMTYPGSASSPRAGSRRADVPGAEGFDFRLLRVAHPAGQRARPRAAHLMDTIRQVHAASYGTYGHRRLHAELVLGQGVRVSRGRVERLMRCTGCRACTAVGCAAAPAATRPPRRRQT